MESNATAERLGGAQRGEGRVSIRPTVLIGLGGTGKEVLRRLRRMFYEKYRMVGLPVMEYLWFDTDIRNIDIMENETDLLDRRIDFSAGEMVDGRVMPRELEGYRNNKGMYPHIWSWFPKALDNINSTSITQGAGQNRPCGRLAFFHHYKKLREEIQRKVNHVRSQEAESEMKKLFPQYDADPNDLEIVLVTSIAGGTGSGSFIDMGFLCRDLFPNAVSTAYLVLPSVFDWVPGKRQTTRANGFAALKELEHYMQPHFDIQGADVAHSTKHKFKWDEMEHEVEAPPFSTVYLFDDSNLAGVRIADFTDVFQMIAEFLLLDFEDTRFAMDKRSTRSNMEQFLQEVVTYKSDNYVQYFPCRYASFGLSQVEINQPRLANAASNKFAQHLVDFIIAAKNEVPSGFSTADVRPHLEQIELTTDQLINRALNRPGADFTLADHAINEILRPVFTDLQQSILKAPEAQDVAVLERQVAEARSKVESIKLEIQQTVAEKLKEEGTIKGEDIKQIRESVYQLIPDLEDRVEDYCIDMLCNPLERGPNYVEKFLEYSKEELASVLRDLNRLANEPMEDPKITAINIELSEDFHLFEQRLKEAEELVPAWQTKKIAVRYYEGKKAEAFRKDAQLITKNLRYQVETIERELSDWVRKRFRKDAARFLGDLVERIISQLGSRAKVIGDDGKNSIKVSGLQAQIEHFRENLQEMSRGFLDIHQAYIQRVTGERNLNLTPDLNYSEEIQDHLRQVKRWPEPDLPHLCRGGLAKYFRSEAKSLFANIATAQGEDIDTIKAGTREIFNRSANRGHSPRNWDVVRRTIDKYTFEIFRDFKTDIHATEELRNHYQEQDEIVKRSQIAAPRISKTSMVLPGLENISDNRIGVGSIDNNWLSRVHRVASPHQGDPYQATEHNPDAIVFVNQWVAFPILSIGNIFDLYRDYRANIEANAINVYRRHMIENYVEFADILPPQNDGEVRALINAQSSLINGLIMDIVKYDQDIRKGFHRPFILRGIEDLDRYGHNLERARLMIGNKSDAKDRLDIAIRTMEDQWRRENRDECFIQRLALKSWLLSKVFPSTQIRVGSRDISADHTFRILLETSYHSDYDQALKQFNLSEAILDEKLEKLRNEIGTFATPLSYRDQFCNDDIYVMK